MFSTTDLLAVLTRSYIYISMTKTADFSFPTLGVIQH